MSGVEWRGYRPVALTLGNPCRVVWGWRLPAEGGELTVELVAKMTAYFLAQAGVSVEDAELIARSARLHWETAG